MADVLRPSTSTSPSSGTDAPVTRFTKTSAAPASSPEIATRSPGATTRALSRSGRSALYCLRTPVIRRTGPSGTSGLRAAPLHGAPERVEVVRRHDDGAQRRGAVAAVAVIVGSGRGDEPERRREGAVARFGRLVVIRVARLEGVEARVGEGGDQIFAARGPA